MALSLCRTIMWSYSVTFLVYLYYFSSEFASACPVECKCANSKVDCSSRDLTSVPDFRELPNDTIYLDLRSNSIERINAEDLQHLTEVQTLVLRFNRIKEIENGAFSNMPKLKSLDLSGNYLKNFTRNIFADLSSLHALDLSQNYLENLDGAFTNLTNLYRLDLAHNNLKMLTDGMFTDMKGLMYLMISHNLIAKIGRTVFYPLTKLSYLVLKNNPLYNVDSAFSQNTRMSYADFSSCNLQSIPQGLPWVLRYLQLTLNNITSVRKKELTKYYYVGVIVLDQNQIDTIENGSFSHMRYLRELWFNGNKLTTIPEQLPLGLRSIYLDGNEITHLHDHMFNNRSKLMTFSLKGNHIREISSKHFDKLTELKKLYIDNNNLSRIEDFTFKSLGKLETLYLSRNPLQELSPYSFYGLRQLQELQLAFILTDVKVDEMTFSKIPELTKLELHYSPKLAKTICDSPAILQSMTNLTELNLMSADMTAITPEIKLSLTNLEKLKLSDNRWHCDRSLLWLNHWMRQAKTLFLDKMDIKCFSPFNLRGKVISSMFDSQFVPTTTTVIITTTMPSFTTLTSTLDRGISGRQSLHTSPGNTPQRRPTSFLTTQVHGILSTAITIKPNTRAPKVVTMTTTTDQQLPSSQTKIHVPTPVSRQTTKVTTKAVIPERKKSTATKEVKTTQPQTTFVYITGTSVKSGHAVTTSDIMTITNVTTAVTTSKVTTQKNRKTTKFRKKKPSNGKKTDQNSVHDKKDYQPVKPIKKKLRRTTTKLPVSLKSVTTFRATRTARVTQKDAQVTSTTAVYQVNDTLRTTTQFLDSSRLEDREEALGQTQAGDSKVTAIATSISVAVLVLILIVVGYLAFRYRRNRVIYHRAIHYKQSEDVMCFISVTESESTKAIKDTSRSERGSVSSITSEDITSEEGGMKVYHWDDKTE